MRSRPREVLRRLLLIVEVARTGTSATLLKPERRRLHDAIPDGDMETHRRRVAEAERDRQRDLATDAMAEVVRLRAEPDLQWSDLRPALDLLGRFMAEADVSVVAVADANQAYVRDYLDGVGLQVTDPQTLYTVLVTAALVTDMISNAARAGQVHPHVVMDVGMLTQTLAAVCLPYLPPEARG